MLVWVGWTSCPSRPNGPRSTIWFSYGSNFRFGEGTGTVASPLVLRRDAQDVRKRFYTGEDTDAFAWPGVGGHRDGSCSQPQTTCLVALHATRKSACRGAHRLPLLNRCQFCRGQKSGPKR